MDFGPSSLLLRQAFFQQEAHATQSSSEGVTEDMGSQPKGHFLVAVDLGTEYTGYASTEQINKPGSTETDEITAFTAWGGNSGYNNYKTRTCLLLNDRGHFMKFGQEAQDAYFEMDEDEQQEVFYFESFKMLLYQHILQSDGHIDENFELTASNGKRWPALKVFGTALAYIKKHFQVRLKDRLHMAIRDEALQWVLTVPAVWGRVGGEFMREAAVQAMLVPSASCERLEIALEPEAAGLYCRELSYHEFVGGSLLEDFSPPEPGQEYVVVDAGGGTIDVIAHRIIDGRKVHEVARGRGAAIGGSDVNFYFRDELLPRLLGEEFMESVRQEYQAELLQLMNSFEKGKRRMHFDVSGGTEEIENAALLVNIPTDFSMLYISKNGGKSLEQRFKELEYPGVTLNRGSIKLQQSVAKELFDPTIQGIVNILQAMTEGLENVHTIYMVGGFSDCNLLRYAVRQTFPQARVLIPDKAGLAVVKGAVRYGRNPNVITERIMQHSYGIETSPLFDLQRHCESHLKLVQGRAHCDRCFFPFIRAGSRVKYNDIISRELHPVDANATEFVADVYSSPRADVRYTNDRGCKKLLSVRLELPPRSEGLVRALPRRPIRLSLCVAPAELQVQAIDITSGVTCKRQVRFLRPVENVAEDG